MCGIVLCYRQKNQVSKEKLTISTKLLAHRGPESQNVWISKDGHLGLGHARLRIIDLKSGDQPLHNESRRIHAVVNGEFYDYKKIRSSDACKGYPFRTESDSEIILALYAKYGIQCVDYLNGEFSFIVWDEEKNIIFSARDRFGVKPLYYSFKEGNLYIASELKSILALGLSAEFSEEIFLSYIASAPSQSRSCFKEIQQVKPGHYIHLDLTHQRFEEKPYWDWNFQIQDDHCRHEADYTEKFGGLLRASVKRRLQSDVPVACALSGGIDSSSILALMAEEYSGNLKAFNISFSESQDYNESLIAQKMANHVGADFLSIPVTQQDIADHYKKAVWHRESYFQGSNSVAKYILSKEINKAGYKVVLTGEGSDELLGGYEFLREDCIAYGGLSSNLVNSDNLALQDTQSEASNLHPRYELVKNRLGYYPAWFKSHCSSTNAERNRLFQPEFVNKYGGYDPILSFLDELSLTNHGSFANTSLYLWSKSFFPETILAALGDRMEMANSVEGRLPFLDSELVNFVSGLPINLKSNSISAKFILKESMKGRVLPEILNREKHPFLAPPSIEDNKKSPMYKLMGEVLFSGLLNKLPFINPNSVYYLYNDLPLRQGRNYTVTEMILHMILSGCFLAEHFV